MAANQYLVIDTIQNKCVNIILWDGISKYDLSSNLILQPSDGSIGIGDPVSSSGGKFINIKFPITPIILTPEDLFDGIKFGTDVLDLATNNIDIMPYYGVLKDLGNNKNITAIKAIIGQLSVENKITADEAQKLNGTLMNQGINLSGDKNA